MRLTTLENGQRSPQLLPGIGLGAGLSWGQEREGGSRGQTRLDFLGQGFPVCALGEAWRAMSDVPVQSPSWAELSPRLGILSFQVFLSVLWKQIGKVNEMNMAKHCWLLRRKRACYALLQTQAL